MVVNSDLIKHRFKEIFISVLLVSILNIYFPNSASADSWSCNLQIPKSGKILSWCGSEPVNIQVIGIKAIGWIGQEPFSLLFSGIKATGWFGSQPVSLLKSGRRVIGWVGQTTVNCNVKKKNNFCLTVTVSGS